MGYLNKSITTQISRSLYRTNVKKRLKSKESSRTDQQLLHKGEIELHFSKAKLFNLTDTAKRKFPQRINYHNRKQHGEIKFGLYP